MTERVTLTEAEWDTLAPYWTGPPNDIYVLQGHQLAALLREAKADALREAADAVEAVIDQFPNLTDKRRERNMLRSVISDLRRETSHD